MERHLLLTHSSYLIVKNWRDGTLQIENVAPEELATVHLVSHLRFKSKDHITDSHIDESAAHSVLLDHCSHRYAEELHLGHSVLFLPQAYRAAPEIYDISREHDHIVQIVHATVHECISDHMRHLGFAQGPPVLSVLLVVKHELWSDSHDRRVSAPVRHCVAHPEEIIILEQRIECDG